MKKKLFAACLVLVVAEGTAFHAMAQQKPEALVKNRQSAMNLISKYFGPLAAMAQGKISYNPEVVARHATYLDLLSEMPWDGFTPDTANEKSRTLPEVYKNASGFKVAQERMASAVDKLVTASKSNNEANVKTAIGEVAKSCSGCHDSFRAKQ